MASTIVVDKIQKTGGVAFVLPVADGNAGQSLQTDGSLGLSWGSVDPIIAKGGDIASASPTVIPDGNLYYDVTGTTGFSAFTVTAGRHFILQFDAGIVMTHHATNLDLPGEAPITTVAGDVAEFVATGTNTAQCINYTRADGTAIVATNLTNTAITTADQSWTGSQRATTVTDNDGSFDLNLGQNFICTVSSGTIAMTFTNIPNGQSGYIKFINSGATMTAHANTKVDATLLATINTAGTYLISYFTDGTDVWLTTSAIYT